MTCMHDRLLLLIIYVFFALLLLRSKVAMPIVEYNAKDRFFSSVYSKKLKRSDCRLHAVELLFSYVSCRMRTNMYSC